MEAIKEKKKKEKKEKKLLNSDPSFVPTSILDIGFEFIINYCKANKQIEWLKELKNTPVKPNKKGKERQISFIEIRNEFTKKFFPDIAPMPMEPKKTMYEMIDEL